MKTVDLAKLLPSDVPPGEQVLWHGRPETLALLRRAFRADFVLAYFVALAIWNAATAPDAIAAVLIGAKTLGIGAAALALLAPLALAHARASLYVITTRRLVIKAGVALPIFINLPFSQIESAAVKLYADGTADIPVAIVKGQRVAYLALWPHARPLRFSQPQPTLRAVAKGAEVADALSRALLAASSETDAKRQAAVVLAPGAAKDALAGRPAAA